MPFAYWLIRKYQTPLSQTKKKITTNSLELQWQEESTTTFLLSIFLNSPYLYEKLLILGQNEQFNKYLRVNTETTHTRVCVVRARLGFTF